MSMEEVPHLMAVAPTLTDPSMRNEKSGRMPSSQQILEELGEANTEMRKTIFNDQQTKTLEEQSANEKQGMSTLLIIVFALIVIALVALIVWMVVKQNEPKTEPEVELRERLRPHPRNGMPQMPPQMQQMPPHMQQQMMQQQQAQQQQMMQQKAAQAQAQIAAQAAAQGQQQAPPKQSEPDDEEVVEEEVAAPVQPTDLNMPPIADLSGDDSADDIDDIIAKTSAMQNDDSELSDMDRNMLKSFAENSYNEDDEDEEDG